MQPKYPIKAQNATNTESTDVAVFIVPDGAISGNEVDISAGGGVAIGDTITDATEGSVLFAGAAGVLAQNNTAFKWVNADTQLQLTAGAATKIPLRINLAAAQSASAFEIYTSGAYRLFRVDPNGNVYGDNAFIGGVFSETGQGFRGEATGDRLDPSVAGQFSLKRYSTNLILSFLGAGAAVASATALPTPTGRIFHVTGTTNITSITSTAIGAGCIITLVFDGVLTVTDGNNLKLAGDFITTADDTLTLGYDGTNWYEIARSAN